MKNLRLCFISLLLLSASFLFATKPDLQFVELGDMPLFSGETLRDCRMGYRLIGEPNHWVIVLLPPLQIHYIKRGQSFRKYALLIWREP